MEATAELGGVAVIEWAAFGVVGWCSAFFVLGIIGRMLFEGVQDRRASVSARRSVPAHRRAAP